MNNVEKAKEMIKNSNSNEKENLKKSLFELCDNTENEDDAIEILVFAMYCDHNYYILKKRIERGAF